MRRLADAGGSNPQSIADGHSDAAVVRVLQWTAPPGHSRHHTGYAIDLACAGTNFFIFKTTPCYAWLSKHNYQNAKKFGWVPSYPEGAVNQGPELEAWEYIWVGTTLLYE
jgi:LAS superfamily LD-carboxypeptidase LdcB